jgi:hypothetical protein
VSVARLTDTIYDEVSVVDPAATVAITKDTAYDEVSVS